MQTWINEDCPVIAARAKAAGVEIHRGDESGLRSDDVRGRGIAPRGRMPLIRVNDKRHGLSVISAVTNTGQMRWRIFDGAGDANILIDLLRRQPQRIRKHIEHGPVRHAVRFKFIDAGSMAQSRRSRSAGIVLCELGDGADSRTGSAAVRSRTAARRSRHKRSSTRSKSSR